MKKMNGEKKMENEEKARACRGGGAGIIPPKSRDRAPTGRVADKGGFVPPSAPPQKKQNPLHALGRKWKEKGDQQGNDPNLYPKNIS